MKTYIKEQMDDLGVSNTQLSERMGKSPQQISNIANGDKNLSMNMLQQVADALGVEPWRLLAPRDVRERRAGGDVPRCPYCGRALSLKVGTADAETLPDAQG